MRKAFFLFCYTLVLYIFLFYSCQSPKDNENLKIFKYNQFTGLTSLDPAFAKNQANVWVVNQLFNGLVQLDNDLQIQPCIAKSWRISDDGKQLTFLLRNDVFFHPHHLFGDNQARKVVAQDFVYSFERIIDGKTASPGAWIFNDKVIENKPFIAVNDSVFVINLKAPFLPILGILSMPYAFVVPHEIVAFYGKDFRAHPIGTGPFYLKVWEEGTALVALKNDHYFETENEQQLPHLDGFKVTFSENRKMEFLSFTQGKLDMISSLDKQVHHQVLNNDGTLLEKWIAEFNLQRKPYLNTEYLGINLHDNETFLDALKIRQAIQYGIDKKAIVDFIKKGIGYPAYDGFVPPVLKNNARSLNRVNYKPDTAKLLLNEANYDGQLITLYTNDSYKDIGLLISSQLQKIGLNVKIEVAQPSILREWMAQGQVPLFRASWIADYPDAENFLALFYGKNGAPPNYTRFNNATFNQLYENSLSEKNDSLRFHLYNQMDSIVMYESPVIPLFYDEVILLTQKNIKGLVPNSQNNLHLKWVGKE